MPRDHKYRGVDLCGELGILEPREYFVGEILNSYTDHGSFSWTNGNYVVLKVDDDTLWMAKLENGFKDPQKFDDGRYMASCTGKNNTGLSRTGKTYELEKNFKHQ